MTFWVTDIDWRVAFYCELLGEKEEKERTSQFNAGTKRARVLLRDGGMLHNFHQKPGSDLMQMWLSQIFCGRASEFHSLCHQYLASSLAFQAFLPAEKRNWGAKGKRRR